MQRGKTRVRRLDAQEAFESLAVLALLQQNQPQQQIGPWPWLRRDLFLIRLVWLIWLIRLRLRKDSFDDTPRFIELPQREQASRQILLIGYPLDSGNHNR